MNVSIFSKIGVLLVVGALWAGECHSLGQGSEPHRDYRDYEERREIRRIAAEMSQAFNRADFGTAEKLAVQVLGIEKSGHFETGSEANARHTACVVLGHCALRKGDAALAGKWLLEATRVVDSSRTRTMGPDMSLAEALLRQGEVAPVLTYLEAWRPRWQRKAEEMEDWIALIKGGRIPKFGINTTLYVRVPPEESFRQIGRAHAEGVDALPPEPVEASPLPEAPPQLPEPSPPRRDVRKIDLAFGWDTILQGGSMTLKDLSTILTRHTAASDELEAEPVPIYQGVTYLMPVAEARKVLGLEGKMASKVMLSCPGFPRQSTFYYAYDGMFEGGYNRLYLVVDRGDQVVSVQLVAENPHVQRGSPMHGIGQNWFTYNFVNNRSRASKSLYIGFDTKKNGRTIEVRSELWQKDSRTYSSKCKEKVAWYLPESFAGLILYCIQQQSKR